MRTRPNILFLMTDQMQGRVLDPSHICRTPNFDRLIERGVRFRRAYTPNAVCSPARASLMTGLLPHNHGVLEVIHCVDEDQSNLRPHKPHWAQRLALAGYRTGYFGKWHVERTNDLTQYGWDTDGNSATSLFQDRRAEVAREHGASDSFFISKMNDQPPGYRHTLLYGVTDLPPEARGVGITTDLAYDFLEEATVHEEPWCCFVSVTEPHDPFVAGEEAFSLYDVDAIELPPNVHDDLAGRPGIYRKAGLTWDGITDRELREAAACYYASITEIDEQYGRLLSLLETRRALDDTIVILTSDHGELLGAHGLFCKNFSAFEEVYNIPMVVAGPGVAKGVECDARVGLHDLCPTLVDLAGAEPIRVSDSRSVAPLLADPNAASDREWRKGYAEYHGNRFKVTQRVIWDGPWKLVWNGFDFDELYNLDDDPYEMTNLAEMPSYRPRVNELMAHAWNVIRATDDRSLLNSHYPILRLGSVGPDAV